MVSAADMIDVELGWLAGGDVAIANTGAWFRFV